MNRENFIKTLLPTRGLYVLFAKHKDQEYPKQTFHQTVDDLLAATEEYDGFDLYYGLATYKEEGNRTQNNVEEIKSFFLDLDAKDFGSKKDAVIALDKFLKASGLPKPHAMVDSGRGVHVYWLLSKPVTADKWKPVADKLKELCAQHGFKADPAVTSDVARILRIPGTFNHKQDNPLPCTLKRYDESAELVTVETFSSALGYTYVENMTFELPAGFENLEDSLTDKLSGNLEASFKTIMVKTQQGKGCKQLANAVVNSAHLDEPTWRGALSIAIRCVDNSTALKKVSDKHPDYSESNTRKKAEETKGPYTCDMLDGLNPGICDNCPNRGSIKSPIVLGHRVAEPEKADDDTFTEPTKVVRDGCVTGEITTQMPKPPKGYVYGKHGGVYYVEQDEDGNPQHKLVCSHTFYVTDRTYDPIELKEALVVRVHLPQDGVRSFILANTELAASDKLRDKLAEKGILSENVTQLRRYVMAWVNHYQQTTVAKKPIRQYGWQSDEFETFVLGEKQITDKGVQLALPSERTASYNSYFDPKGSLAGWVENMKFWEDPKFVQQQYAMGLAFGSIFMQRDNTNASILHLYTNDSGVGKSTVMEAIAGVWGNPEPLIMQQSDKILARMNRCEIMHNIPVLMDEITNSDAFEASDLIYQMSSGMQRNRMNASSNTERTRGEPWSLFAITSANSSIIDRIMGRGGKSAPEAEAQRVLEMRVKRLFPKGDFAEKPAVENFRANLKKHYGHAGEVFVQWVINNPIETDMIIAKVREAVDQRARLSVENRFWSPQATYSVAALIICKKIGLLNYNAKEVLKYVVQSLIPENKQRTLDMQKGAMQTVSEYVAEHFNNFIQVKDESDVVTMGDGVVVPPEEKARIKVLGRYESEKQMLHLICGPFQQWCADKHVNYQNLLSELKDLDNRVSHKRARLGTGTKLSLPNTRILSVPWNPKSEKDNADEG